MIFEGGSKIMCPSEVDEMILLTDKKHFINLREREREILFISFFPVFFLLLCVTIRLAL